MNKPPAYDFSHLSALFINCSLKPSVRDSHTQRLMSRVAGVMRTEGVAVESLYALDYDIAFGMVKDAREESGAAADDWPLIQQKVLAADILVIGTPIWLGAKSSVSTLVIERLYAYSGDRNDKGQYIYYGKAGGVVVTGNEDGAKACAKEILYSLSHIGYMIPPQADCAWLGEAGPGPSYGDTEYAGQPLPSPAGYDNEFTNRSATIMAWNLMHTAALLRQHDGLPAVGNVADRWRDVTNAADQNLG